MQSKASETQSRAAHGKQPLQCEHRSTIRPCFDRSSPQMRMALPVQPQQQGGSAADGPAPKLTPRQRRLAKQKRQHAQELERRKQHRLLQRQVSLPPPPPPPASGSRQLDCVHFHACSGCTLEAGLDDPPVLEEAQHFFITECGLPSFQLTAGPAQHWRHRARLAVRAGHNGQPVVGLFAEGSHIAIGIPSCVVHHPTINAAMHLLQVAMADCGVLPYDEASGTGELRYVQAAVVDSSPAGAPLGSEAQAGPNLHGSSSCSTSSASSGSSRAGSSGTGSAVQLALVWNASLAEAAEGTRGGARLEALAARLWQLGRGQQQAEAVQQQSDSQQHRDGPGQGAPGLLHSLWANFQPGRSNAILGPEWRLLRGEEEAWAQLGGADICFGPGSFMQANPGAMDSALAAMQAHVPAGSTITDLHAGVGTIGLSLAATRSPRWVRFVEINSQGLPPFQRSAARLQLWLQQAEAAGGAAAGSSSSSGSRGEASSSSSGGSRPVELEYHVAAAGSDPERWCRGAEVVVLDPPRKGLEPALLSWLCGAGATAAGVRRLVYLSCGYPALRRDCSALLASERWRLAHAEAFLFFPGADHVETLCVFDAA